MVLRDDKSFPYILIARDHAVAADPQASRRAQPQGRLFRPIRLGRRRRPHHQHAAARLSAALLHRRLFREPHAAVPALPDQALLRALHRRNRARRIWRAGRRGARFLAGESEEVKRRLRALMDEASLKQLDYERAASYRDRLTALSATSSRTRASTRRASRRPTSSPSIRRPARPASRCSSSAPARTGATAPISRAPIKRFGASEVLESFVAQFYDDKPPPQLDPAVARDRRSGAARGGACRRAPAARSRSRCRSAAKSASWSTMRCAMRARRLARRLAETSSQGAICWRGLPSCSISRSTPGRIEVYDNSHIMGTNAGRRHDRRRSGRLHQKPISEVQHPLEDLAPGDDYAMMREMLQRRFTRLAQGSKATRIAEDVAWALRWPDLVLIDGGPGQLTRCAACSTSSGIDEIKRRRRRQGAGPRCRARALLSAGPGSLLRCSSRATGALLHPAAPRRGASLRHRRASRPAQEGDGTTSRSTRSAASGRRASARCSSISARPRRSAAPAIDRSRRRSTASARRWPRRSTTTSTRVMAR